MLQIVIWDVQHGSAAYIKTPNNKHIVQDLGIGAYKANLPSFSPLLHLKNKLGVDKLDEVIISHPHRDHLDDIVNFDDLNPTVLLRPKHLSEKEILDANRMEDRAIIEKYLEINERYNSPVAESEQPLLPENNGGVVFQWFIPKNCDRSNINNHSVVNIITYATSKIIIPGDNEPDSWEELLGSINFKNAIKNTDILVASHHGRKSGFCAEIFEYFTPKLVIISDGRFCDSSATSRYSDVASGWTVHSKQSGDINRKCVTTRSDGDITIKIGKNENNRPYLSVSID
jgi:beta-lactamase superfamily II metal-dependent hydrolase